MNITIEKFGYPHTLIKEYENWVVLLRPKQVTLGSLVIAAKSEVSNLGQLSSAAWTEFTEVSHECETLLTTQLNAEKFNYLALMMKDPNVHFHFIPRYSKPINFNGHTFTDSDWPLKTELTSIEMDDKTFQELYANLRKNGS